MLKALKFPTRCELSTFLKLTVVNLILDSVLIMRDMGQEENHIN
jgi:hypothetical protein